MKKQTRPLQLAIEDAVEEIAARPEEGELKTGDLAGFRVYKFTFQKQLFLIAYRLQADTLYFYQIGTHENFYSTLKRYLREAQ